jgi:hypothetical protein
MYCSRHPSETRWHLSLHTLQSSVIFAQVPFKPTGLLAFGLVVSSSFKHSPAVNAADVGGFMYRRIALAIFRFSISVHCCAQRDPERRWTDKNNAEQYAAYMIQIAYNDRGYMGARVQVLDGGARNILEVDMGRIYHVKAMQILSRNDLPAQAVSTAPTVGDVYSAARINASMNGSPLSKANATGRSVGVCDEIMQLPIARLEWDKIRPPSTEVVILRQITVAGPAEQESGADWSAAGGTCARRSRAPFTAHCFANHRDGRVPTRNSVGGRKISAHVPAHAAKSCHPQSPSGRLPV